MKNSTNSSLKLLSKSKRRLKLSKIKKQKVQRSQNKSMMKRRKKKKWQKKKVRMFRIKHLNEKVYTQLI